MRITYSCGHQKLILETFYPGHKFVPIGNETCLNFKSIRGRAGTTVEPHRVKNETCFLLLLTNLAEPDWISISCESQILHWFFCATVITKKNMTFLENDLRDKTYYCSLMYTMLDNKCISFHWVHNMTLRKLPCRNQHFISVKKFRFFIQSILDAVSYTETCPVFIFQSNSKQIFMYKYERYLNTYHQNVTEVEVIMAEGFYTCIKSKNTTFAGRSIFQCNNGHYISHTQICNGKIQCHLSEEDEKFCSCDKHKHLSEKIFCNAATLNYTKKECSPLYFITVQGSCHLFDKISFYEMKTIIETKTNNGSSLKTVAGFKDTHMDNDTFICKNGTI